MDRNELHNLPKSYTCIYKITSPTNRVYVGQSINIKNRYRVHLKSKADTKLYRSFQKYGHESHKFEILKECEKCDLERLENYYIKKYDSIKSGLNILDKSYTLKDTSKCKNNYKWTDKRRKEHSDFIKKWWKNNPNYKRTEDWKKKLSESQTGKVTAKDKNGNFISISKEEFDTNPNYVGVSSGIVQPKLFKGIICITDNIKFKSVKEAANYYGFSSSGNIITSIKKSKPIGMAKHKRELYFKYLEE